ncbi:DNA ligase D [Oceanobacillus kapialis]|uniref:DNA ligase (ATP) n=1 Tax=Oceanobacillus kapialis TaxID=481353 RepID=A0ABW5Q0Y7_9BACI
MKVMKPIASSEIPTGEDWLYEVKYDGFRCVLHWEKDTIRLTSKNAKNLSDSFPEVVEFCLQQSPSVANFLPLTLDGELVVLNTAYQANFALLQHRGRLKDSTKIKQAAKRRPASFLAFDVLTLQGQPTQKDPLLKRKEMLKAVFKQILSDNILSHIPAHSDHQKLWNILFTHKGEGIIAKRKNSAYQAGKAHRDWYKIKNWRHLHGFLTSYDPHNNYFAVSIYEKEHVIEIGKCAHGLSGSDFQTLKEVFLANGEKSGTQYHLPPAICAEINSLDLYKNELREPAFASLLPEEQPANMTRNRLALDMAMLPKTVDLTNIEKIFWPKPSYTKGDLLIYAREISPYMLPFFQERALTIIRSPAGVEEDFFFQKHLPDYAPDFIERIPASDDEFLLPCEDLNSLMWYANHGTVEFHVPFQKRDTEFPAEIVFDLDPPDRQSFPLAIEAASLLKELLDELQLISYVKTSGNKGLQIYIPLPERSMTYEQTALFTQAMAWTIEKAQPTRFTTERMKKNRGDRLYIDYVQHGKDKTIIAPYSPRKTPEGTVATPLFWEEVKEGLLPEQFTIKNVPDRVKELGCPFADYHQSKQKQPVTNILTLII